MALTKIWPFSAQVPIVYTDTGNPTHYFNTQLQLLLEASGVFEGDIATINDSITTIEGDITTIETTIANLELNDLADVDTTGASNGDVLEFDGTDWVAAAPSGGGGGNWWAGNEPAAADFPNNQSGDAIATTITDDTDLGVKVDFGNMVSGRFRVRSKDLPSAGAADWSVTARMMFEPVPGQVTDIGLGLLESATAKYSSIGLLNNGTGATNIRSSRGTLIAFGAALATGHQVGLVPLWLKATYNHAAGTTQFQTSYNGKDFNNHGGTFTNATCYTTRADKVGFMVINGSTTGTPCRVYCDYWVQSW
jgi:hypothetical protein